MSFEEALKNKTFMAEEIINKYLPEKEGYQQTVIEAMNYSVSAGGKRLRPVLMQETFSILGGKGSLIEPFMAAIEMIHTYSLVHDDLPAMDNDELRRGKATTWKKYGDGMAVLAGDGLLNYAFETAMSAFDLCKNYEEKDRVIKALKILAAKAGIYGMIGGQTADVESENAAEDIPLEKLLFIHTHKTAALIEASMMTGAVLAGADEGVVGKLQECARKVGIAFQIRDDILDVEGDSAELGKMTGSDAANHKQTYVTRKGLEEAEREVHDMSEEAAAMLDGLEEDSGFLKQLIFMLVGRCR